MTLGGVYLVTLVVLVTPGSPARSSWRFPESPSLQLDHKVRFVDTSSDVTVDKNRISDEPTAAGGSRQYCECSGHHTCEESRGQQTTCPDGTRLCCSSTPRHNVGPAHERHPSRAADTTLTTGQRLRDYTADGLFIPTRDVQPRGTVRDKNNIYVSYLEEYPGAVRPAHTAHRSGRPDSAVAHSYTFIYPYEPIISVESQKRNKNRYFLAGPDELGGHHAPADFGGGRGARRYMDMLPIKRPTGQIGHDRHYSRPGTNGVLVGPGGPAGSIGPGNLNDGGLQHSGILVGPDGPTGIVGPGRLDYRPESTDVLVGPEGPTGSVGPNKQYSRPDVLVGPGGPTGVVGPSKSNNVQQYPDVLVGPGGPAGVIGPGKPYRGPDTTAVLVGPGGPTGVVGPDPDRQYGRPRPPGVLMRPGGPDHVNEHKQRTDVLVGPGGPSGIIGPGRPYDHHRPILVGPGGFTGNIGPYYVQRANRDQGGG